jgi:thiamine kinase-like enzyme
VAVGETALVGVPLYTQLHRGNARELAYRAADWLVQLVHEPRPQPRASFWDQLVEPLLAEFSQRFGPVLDPALWERTRVILEALDHCPLACEHRDFSPWNVLIAPSGELVVHDWEGARLRGLPVLDLLYFLAHLGFFLDGAYTSLRFRQSLRQALNPATLTGSIRAEVLAHYLRRLDLDPALLAPLRVLVWLPHAAAEYQRLVADELVNPAPERLREALFPGLWEDELRDLMSLPTWR